MAFIQLEHEPTNIQPPLVTACHTLTRVTDYYALASRALGLFPSVLGRANTEKLC